MKIIMANDHSATKWKNEMKKFIEMKGHQVIDVGTYDEQRTDYPLYGQKAYQAYLKEKGDYIIAICGSGVGIGVAINKVGGNAILVDSVAGVQKAKDLLKTKQFSIGARVTTLEIGYEIIDEILR